MSERERLLRRIATIDFAIVEFHLYMDTHPNAEDINKKLNEYEQKSRMLRNEYEEKYGPLVPGNIDGNQWAWISNPWPWDNDGEAE